MGRRTCIVLIGCILVVTYSVNYLNSEASIKYDYPYRSNVFEGSGSKDLIQLYRPNGSILMEAIVEHWRASAAGIEFISVNGKSIVTNVPYVVVKGYIR